MKIPCRDEALKMMREAGCSHQVIDHCVSVTRIALNMGEELSSHGVKVNIGLVEAGALLHDIGRSRTHSVEHGAIGGEMARKLKLPESLARVIERHVGGGITPEEADRIGMRRGNYVPKTLEEKIVAYADKLIEGDRQVDIQVTLEKFEDELGVSHPALVRLRALHDEMASLIGVGF